MAASYSAAKQQKQQITTAELFGQDHVLKTILPYIDAYNEGLNFEDKPIGSFMLLGPTGTGKTKTVETVSQILHGNEKHILRIDCGEYQLEHEVAKLIGAPPGYLGHRETTPMITQAKLNALLTDACPISIVLFDEIEKAAESLQRLLLGVLDKATLNLGDNSKVHFTRSLIFMTSNLGSDKLQAHLKTSYGFAKQRNDLAFDKVCISAVKKKFTPEFVNRVDEFISYKFLTKEAISDIFDMLVGLVNKHIRFKKGVYAYTIEFTPEAKQRLIETSVSDEFGARELKRNIQKLTIQKVPAVLKNLTYDVGRIIIDYTGNDFTVTPEEKVYD